MGIIALGLCGGSENGGIIPINKNLWSASFILANASLSYILLTFCLVIIDVKNWWQGQPFYYAGMNAILLYCGHGVIASYFPFNLTTKERTHATVLIRSVVGTSMWLIISYILYRKKMFFKI